MPRVPSYLPSRQRLQLFSIGLAALLAVIALPGTAQAQSENELRRENQALRAQVEELTSDLEAQQKMIESLKAQLAAANREVAQLRSAANAAIAQGTTTPTPPLPTEPVSIDESTPESSPRGLFSALKKDYEESMAEVDPGAEGESTRIAFFRSLNSWTARANRAFRNRIEWRIRVLEGEQSRDGLQLRAVAVDPVHGTELGDPFIVYMTNRGAISRFQRSIVDLDQDTFVLKGVLNPTVRVNRDRAEPGAFNNPPLIGPWVEFGFAVEGSSITIPPAPDEDEDQKS